MNKTPILTIRGDLAVGRKVAQLLTDEVTEPLIGDDGQQEVTFIALGPPHKRQVAVLQKSKIRVENVLPQYFLGRRG